MAVRTELIEQLTKGVRVKSSVGREEITNLAEACKRELEISGVYIFDETDPLFEQVLKLYCKANYGYDKDSEKFRAAYADLRDSMALSGDYKKRGDQDG